jgi:hypothetical protein
MGVHSPPTGGHARHPAGGDQRPLSHLPQGRCPPLAPDPDPSSPGGGRTAPDSNRTATPPPANRPLRPVPDGSDGPDGIFPLARQHMPFRPVSGTSPSLPVFLKEKRRPVRPTRPQPRFSAALREVHLLSGCCPPLSVRRYARTQAPSPGAAGARPAGGVTVAGSGRGLKRGASPDHSLSRPARKASGGVNPLGARGD